MKTELPKRYVRPYMYNAVKCLNAMCNEIYKRGGHIVSDWASELQYTEIHCRKDSLKMTDVNVDDIKPVITPLYGCFASYMRFELGGHIYYLEIPDNMFDDIRYTKIACDDNLKVSSKGYSDAVMQSSAIIDTFYNQNPASKDNEVLYKVATELLDWLVKEARTNPYQDTVEIQVPNTYDNGYHTERKPVKYSNTYKRFDITTGQLMLA